MTAQAGWSKWAKSLVPPAATAVGGLLVGVVCVAKLEPAASTAVTPKVQPASSSSSLHGEDKRADQNTAALLALQARVAQLETERATAGPSPSARADSAAVDTEAPAPPPPSPEESRKRALELQDTNQRRLDAESVDPEWAPAAKAALEDKLAQIGTRANFSVSQIECKTSLCQASLQWPSYKEASAHWMAALVANYGKKCQTSVTVPRPSDIDAPYEGRVFFDCTEERAQ